MSTRYRAAIIGCGDIGHAHADGYVMNDEVDLVAVVDPLEVAREQFVREYGAARAYRSVEDLFAEEVPDLVSVCTWHRLHATHTIAAARAGAKAVISEKPMTTSLGEADAMIDACRESGTRLVVGHQRRFTPGWEAARELVAGGEIGEVQLARGSTTAGLLNVGTHAIDGLRFVLGDPAAEWVLGAVERNTNRYERELPAEDCCAALVQLVGGGQLLVESDLVERHGRRGIMFRFEGSDGVVECSESFARVLSPRQAGWKVVVDLERVDSIGGKANARQVAELLRWLEGGPVHRSEASVGRAAVEIMMATYESARRHSRVRLPLEEPGNPLGLMIEEGKLDATGSEPYDIRDFLRREGIDEARYAELRAADIGRHHQVMHQLWKEREAASS